MSNKKQQIKKQQEFKRRLFEQALNKKHSSEGAFLDISCERVDPNTLQLGDIEVNVKYEKIVNAMSEEERKAFEENSVLIKQIISTLVEDQINTYTSLSNNISKVIFNINKKAAA